MRPPRLRTKDVSTPWGSDREAPPSGSHLRGEDVAFSSANEIGTWNRPVSELDTQPVVSPVNASRRPSRAETSCITRGPGRLARPYPVEDLHLLSFASFLAHTLVGQRVFAIALG